MMLNNWKSITVLLLCVCCLPLCAPAQGGGMHRNWDKESPLRFKQYIYVCNDVVAATTTLSSNDIIVNGYDVSSGTSVATGSINNPTDGPRRLAVQLSDNAGSDLDGTVTIRGKFYDVPMAEKITFSNGGGFKGTTVAFTEITAIDYDLNDNAASDVLNIGVYYFGVPINASSLLSVTFSDASSASATSADSGTWSNVYHTYTPSNTLADGDMLVFTAYEDARSGYTPKYVESTASSNSF